MQWFFIALGAPFLWALVNIADQYLISKYSEKEKERSSGGLVIFSSVIGLFIAFAISLFTPRIALISSKDMLLLLFAGALSIVWIILYLYALEIEETSTVIPWFLTVPIFGYILGYFLLKETLTANQILGGIIILLGLVLISFDLTGERKRFKHKPVFYILAASLLIAISGAIFKYVTTEGDFWVSSFWEYLGLGITGLFLFIFATKHRSEFLRMRELGGRKIFFVNIGSELITILGNLLTNFALLLAPVTMVFLVGSFQPAMVLLLTILGTKFFPHIIKENLSKHALTQKIIAVFVMTLGSVILFL